MLPWCNFCGGNDAFWGYDTCVCGYDALTTINLLRYFCAFDTVVAVMIDFSGYDALFVVIESSLA